MHSKNWGTHVQFEYGPKTSRDRRTRWCHLPTIPGTTLHCLVDIGGDVNSIGTRRLF